jgi:basic membrane lipoprotein Med (substrate-binding protein (PBP1-ABC) superfamily)
VLFVLTLGSDLSAQVDWKRDWETTLQAAEKEGRLTLYLNRGPNWDAVLAEFRKEYPRINIVLVTGTGNEVENRILAERRAGKHLGDVLGGSP